MKLLFLAYDDFAASGNGFARAMRAVGYDADCIVTKPHKFQYPHEGKVISRRNADGRKRIQGLAGAADVVFAIQSPDIFEREIGDKKIVPLYGGDAYRQGHAELNARFAERSLFTIVYEADLMDLGAKNEHLVLPPIEECLLEIKLKPLSSPLIVGHYPTWPLDKGTNDIVPAMLELEKAGLIEFRCAYRDMEFRPRFIRHVSWTEQIKRMSECDVIIDQIKPTLTRGNMEYPFGEWVSCALEGAALGKLVFTNSRKPGPYSETYQSPPRGLLIVNTVKGLVDKMREVTAWPDYMVRAGQERARAWAKQMHSLKNTGQIVDGLLRRYL